jgi:hypothetical protein
LTFTLKLGDRLLQFAIFSSCLYTAFFVVVAADAAAAERMFHEFLN